ncbi:MAG TPA: SOS response-associated peptidase family protein [Steroidobacteraceae bacterium]|nr:SOS response-associated peptidase family protein [Steroidobacteraceae bacterium]
MCQRLVVPNQDQVEKEVSVAHPWWRFSVRFNVAVTQRVPVARLHEGEREGVMVRWGFVPEPEEGEPFEESRVGAAHVRSEALVDSHDYRNAWLNAQRCIVPIAGFYTWHLSSRRVRQPYYARLVNRAVFGVAALWERTVIERRDVIESCALLTVPANELLAGVSGSRMPAILDKGDYEQWLTAPVPEAQRLLKTYSGERMVIHPVGPRVNYLQYDDPQLIRPARQS